MACAQKAGLAYKINSSNQHNLHRKHSGDLWKILFWSIRVIFFRWPSFAIVFDSYGLSFDYVVANNCFDVYSIKMNEIVAICTENCNDIANVYCKSFMLFVLQCLTVWWKSSFAFCCRQSFQLYESSAWHSVVCCELMWKMKRKWMRWLSHETSR